MSSIIKVLHIIPHMQIGGINRFVLDLVKYQKNFDNLDIAIFVCSDSTPQWKEKFESLGINIYIGKINPSDINISHYIDFIKIKNNYDIIHWHVYSPLLTMTTYLDKKIHIFTHHSVIGYGRVSKWTDCIKWKLFKYFINIRLDCEVYNSLYTKSFWTQYGLHARQNALIYNGTDYSQATPENVSINKLEFNISNKFCIGTSSNLIEWKRVDILIEAFANWCKDKNDVILLLVGDGAEKDNLQKLVKRLNIAPKVIFTGHQTNVSVFQSLMKICVFPSTTETFGLAALECMHLGKPTICMSDGGGICEIINNKENIVENIEQMTNRFEYYYNLDIKEYEKESADARRRSLLFDMKNKAAEYVSLYTTLYYPKC